MHQSVQTISLLLALSIRGLGAVGLDSHYDFYYTADSGTINLKPSFHIASCQNHQPYFSLVMVYQVHSSPILLWG